jgi:hypothetical protein
MLLPSHKPNHSAYKAQKRQNSTYKLRKILSHLVSGHNLTKKLQWVSSKRRPLRHHQYLGRSRSTKISQRTKISFQLKISSRSQKEHSNQATSLDRSKKVKIMQQTSSQLSKMLNLQVHKRRQNPLTTCLLLRIQAKIKSSQQASSKRQSHQRMSSKLNLSARRSTTSKRAFL